MKEELYKYLSIGLLALLLLVCFGSLITYFVVGQESINTAYAFQVGTGYYEDNLISNSDCLSWSYNITGSSSPFYSDSYCDYYLTGSGASLVNNVFSSSSNGSVLYVQLKDSYSYGSYCGAVGYVSNTGASCIYRADSDRSMIANTSSNFFYSTRNFTPSSNTGIRILLDAEESITLRYFYLALSNGFNGYVPNSYSPNGYNQGYTDGVNSVSGGDDLSGIVDLTDVTWRAPTTAVNTSLSGEYSVSGYLDSIYLGSRYTFDELEIYSGNSVFGDPVEEAPGWYTSPIYLLNSSISGPDNIIPVMANDLIFFTGGSDSQDLDLIGWLEDNSSFLNYTDGYQDGYNSGHDIGYQEGYAEGNTDTIVSLDTYLQPFGSSAFTGVINQDPTTFWWSVQPGMQPNTAVYGYLCFNISSLPIGSIVHFNFPFQKYIVKDNSNVEHEITDIRVLYDVDYYTNLLIAPRDGLPSIRLEQGTETYSFNVIRPGDTIILYFPLNMVTDFNRYTFGLTWSGDEYNYSFTTSSISQDIKTQLDNAYERGLKDGNSQGYSSGYTVGYNEGADGAEHYTFNNLLGAVFDAPITMFLGKYNPQTRMREGGLFNFELLGVNLTGFVIAILSIGVVLFIMRLFIRGL